MSQCGHNHKFVPTSAKHPYYCQRCDQLGFGLSYSCEKNECNIFSHKECENHISKVKHPFSTKCVLEFYFKRSGKVCLCDVCGKGIKGYHYRCSCNFVKRYAHPSCLAYEPALVAFDGLTMNLKKVATAECLRCGKKDLCSKVNGWAYMSECGVYCYHVSCVMDVINENWKEAFMKGTSDPFQTVRDRFPSDMNNMRKLVMKKNDGRKRKKAATVLSALFNGFTGNPMGLIGDAKNFFS